MNETEFKEKIEQLLLKSSVSQPSKQRIMGLLPIMNLGNLEKVYNALISEAAKLNDLEQEEKRLKFKYEMYTEKLNEVKNKEGNCLEK